MGKGIVSIPNLRAKDAMVRKQTYVRTIVMLNEPKEADRLDPKGNGSKEGPMFHKPSVAKKLPGGE